MGWQEQGCLTFLGFRTLEVLCYVLLIWRNFLLMTRATHKYRNLVLGLLLDAVGMVSFAIPGVGEFSDVLWAPMAGWFMTRMYKGRLGQTAGVIAFVEELMPGLDVIPTFTLTWLYTYVLSKKGPQAD